MKEAPGSSETSVLTRATRRNNPEDTILHELYLILELDLSFITYRDNALQTKKEPAGIIPKAE
jgi:hypothetical protein